MEALSTGLHLQLQANCLLGSFQFPACAVANCHKPNATLLKSEPKFLRGILGVYYAMAMMLSRVISQTTLEVILVLAFRARNFQQPMNGKILKYNKLASSGNSIAISKI